MIPVLGVSDIDGARATLARLFGFADAGAGRMALGDQQIAVTDTPPAEMIPLRLDHIALRVGDADATRAAIEARGGHLAETFTPDGPREISEFWDHGVRFVFFDGPEGWPFEFCARVGASDVTPGHDHYGLRSPDIDALEAQLGHLGAERVAAHVLAGVPPVRVRFLQLGATVFEVFDEGPYPAPEPGRGFIGLLPD